MFKVHQYAVAAAAILAAGWCSQSAAVARSATFTRSFSTPRGTATETVTKSFTPSTGVASETEKTTRPNGQTATVSATSTPDGRGGFTNSRSVTTFNGQTYNSIRQVGR